MATVEEQVAVLRAQIADLERQIEELLRPPVVAPPPLPEFLSSHHDPKIPILGHDFTVYPARSGDWTDPAIWSTGKVPSAKDRVYIQPDFLVSLDGQAEADTLIVAGRLAISPDTPTRLTVTTWTILPTGDVYINTDDPDAPGSAFECVFRNAPPDPVADPGQYGRGLLCFGTFTVHGKAKAAWAVPTHAIVIGENFINLSALPSGWEVGDTVCAHDTRQLTQKERALGYDQIERRVIQDWSPDELGVTESFVFDHRIAKNDDGVRDTPFRIVNLSRNVVFRAEVPGTSHLMFTSHPKVDIRYCAFVGMGRTLNEPLGPENPIARYPVHFHHMHPAFHLEGCVVDGGDAPHNRKFGIVVHDTHYSTIKDNVVFNVAGHGIFQETGNEWGNKFTGNTVIRVTGKGGRADAGTRQGGMGMQGGGYWISGPGSEWTDNYAANCFSYAFTYTQFYLGKISFPDAPGSHTLLTVDGNAVGIAKFEGNIGFSNPSGGSFWWLGCVNQKPIPDALPTLIKNFTSVNHDLYGVFAYQMHNVTVDGYKTRGTHTAKAPGALAWYHADYLASAFKLIRADIQGQRTGWSPSAISGKGTQTIEDSLISASAGINFSPPWTNGPRADGLDPRKFVIKNCRFKSPIKGEVFTAIAKLFPALATLGGRTQNLVVTDTCMVEDWQGVKGDNFQLFYVEQAGTFVPPATIPNKVYPGPKVVASPEAGLSNTALWAKYKIAVGGQVAPCSTTRPNVKGFCCK
jgi:hypothetical protein